MLELHDTNYTIRGWRRRDIWHQRLGHLNHGDLNKMVNMSMVEGINLKKTINEKEICDGCIEAKQKRTPSHYPKRKATLPFQRIYIDLSGKIATADINGNNYMLLIVDSKSRGSWLYLSEDKKGSSILHLLIKWHNHIIGQYSPHYILRSCFSDNGSEFDNTDIKAYWDSKGINYTFTQRYSPDMNGIVERTFQTIVTKAHAMLIASKLPIQFWGQACLTANYLRNRSPCYALEEEKVVPYEVLNHEKPNLAHLKIFGCHAWSHIPKEIRSKFEAKSEPCLMMGYSDSQHL